MDWATPRRAPKEVKLFFEAQPIKINGYTFSLRSIRKKGRAKVPLALGEAAGLILQRRRASLRAKRGAQVKRE